MGFSIRGPSSSCHLHWQHQAHFWCLQRCCDSVARALLWEHESPAAVVLLTCRQLLANSATIVPAAFCLPSGKGAEPHFSITQHIRCLGQHNETKMIKRRGCFLLAWSTGVKWILLNSVWTEKTWFSFIYSLSLCNYKHQKLTFQFVATVTLTAFTSWSHVFKYSSGKIRWLSKFVKKCWVRNWCSFWDYSV